MKSGFVVSFFVRGLPAPGGSKKFVGFRQGKAVLIDACARNKSWRELVAWRGKSEYREPPQLAPLSVDMDFYLPRPKGHFAAGGLLRSHARLQPAVRPDVLKLARSTEDALTGIVWKDDALIVEERIAKFYAPPGGVIGVQITVHTSGADPAGGEHIRNMEQPSVPADAAP